MSERQHNGEGDDGEASDDGFQKPPPLREFVSDKHKVKPVNRPESKHKIRPRNALIEKIKSTENSAEKAEEDILRQRRPAVSSDE